MVLLVLVHLTYLVVVEVLEVSFIELPTHSQQQINLLVLPIQSVLVEMELVKVLETPMMVVIEMVEILLSQFLVELLLPKVEVVVQDFQHLTT